jgi:nucleoside-diphosphate-sugar epimerase
MLSGEKILITGAGGIVGYPMSKYLARNNEVWGVARFSDPQKRTRLEAAGVLTRAIDLGAGDLSDLPDDFTYVLHLAWFRAGIDQFDAAFRNNAESAGFVLQHCRKARAALVMSSAAIYSVNNDPWHRYTETDPLGFSFAPWAPTSPMSKVALESVARFAARAFNIPVTIARLNTVYGESVGMPGMDIDSILDGKPITVVSEPFTNSPIHSDDMNEQLESLLKAASVPATIVNWAGDEVITQQSWCAMAAQWAGKEAKVNVRPVPGAFPGCAADAVQRMAITGPCRVLFKDGFRRLFEDRVAARSR